MLSLVQIQDGELQMYFAKGLIIVIMIIVVLILILILMLLLLLIIIMIIIMIVISIITIIIGCPHCDRMRGYLQELGARWVEYDVEADETY